MRKHGFRSIFSLLLALMMVCSLLPTAAFAEGNLEPTDQVTEQPTDQPAGGEVQQPTEKKEDAPQGEQPATPPQTYAVVYADGAENTVFEAKSFPGLTSGEPTPPFGDAPVRDGYTFLRWEPALAETVTESVTYIAQWQEAQSDTGVPGGNLLTVLPMPDPDFGDTGNNTMSGGEVYDVKANSTVVLHPSVNHTVTGVKVKVGDTIDGHPITSISGYDITVDLGKYNVNNDTFRLPYAKDIWYGVDDNKVDYISWAGGGSNRRSEGASALLANGKNTAYYYFKGAPVMRTFTLKYDANGGTGAPNTETYTAKSQYEGSHTFTISSQKPTRDGYTFLGWSTNPNATTADRQPGGSIVVTGTTTLYAVWETKTPPQPDKPGKPTEDDIINNNILGDVTVECTNADVQHGSKSYPLTKKSITSITEPVYDSNAGQYSCMVTVSSTGYVHQFDRDKGGVHTPDDKTKTIQLLYYADAWHGPSGDPSVASITFKVECNEKPEPPKAPDAPSHDDLSKLIGDIIVRCTNTARAHELALKGYALISDSYTTSEVEGDENGYTYTVNINSQKYVEAFEGDTETTHDPKNGTATVTLKYLDAGIGWLVTSMTPVIFDAACVPGTVPPQKPTDKDLEDLNVPPVDVICETKGQPHSASYGLIKGSYGIGEVTSNENGGYTCDITVHAEKYVAESNYLYGVHTLVDGETNPKTLTLKYEDGKWTAGREHVTFEIKCVDFAPTKADLDGIKVFVKCTNSGATHGDKEKEYGLIDGYYYVKTPTFDKDNHVYHCVVEVNGDSYVDQYGKDVGKVQHDWSPVDTRVKYAYLVATWTDNGYVWSPDEDWGYTVTFEAWCDQQAIPAPTAEQVDSLLNVKVTCANMSAAHQKDISAFVYETLLPGSFDIGEVTGTAQSGYECVITVRAAQYVQDFNTRSKATHTPTDGTEKGITLYYENGGWSVGTGSGVAEFAVTCENAPAQTFTVTYKDGVAGKAFQNQSYTVPSGSVTPAFNGTPYLAGYVFTDWTPAVATTVTANATYIATWKLDTNNNGKPDDEEERYTVTYTDGAGGKAFADQVYTGLLSGTSAPKFDGTPVRSGYVFIGWSPVWSGTVTGNVTYTATWSTITGGLDKVPKTGDNGLTLALSALLLFSFCGAAACVVSTKKRG